MFCPIEYIPLSRLISLVPNSGREECRFYCGDISALTLDNIRWTITESDWIESLAISFASEQLFLCSPAGKLLRIDDSPLRKYSNSLHVKEFESSISAIHEPIDDFSLWKEKHNLTDFRGLGFYSQKITSEKDASFFDDAFLRRFHSTFCLLPFFYRRPHYTISLEFFDFVRSHKEFSLDLDEELGEHWRPFEGHALCVSREHFDQGWAKFWDRDSDEKRKVAEDFSFGRPRKLRNITVETLKEYFSEGRNDLPWLEFLRQVNQKSGIGVSLDTLKRAMEEAGIEQNL